MKVAFISQPYDYVAHNFQSSSVGIWTDRAARELMARGIDFIIYTKRFPNQPSVEQHGAIRYRRFSTKADEWLARLPKQAELLLNYPLRRRPFFASSLNYSFWGLSVARDMSRLKPDIVHIQNYSQFVPLVRKLNPKAKIVLHMHREWLTQLDRRMIAPRLEQADLIAGCSDYITQAIRNAFPELAQRCQPIYDGVDPRMFTPDARRSEDGCKRLLFVGRVSPEKGLHVLLEAFKQAAGRVPEAELDIVGAPGEASFEYSVLERQDEKVNNLKHHYRESMQRGGYYSELQSQIPPGLVHKVHFIGYVAHQDLAKYYQNADALVNPSLSEPFGLSLIEAMACQAPVIATKVGGMVEIVSDGKTGLVVEVNDADGLANAIVQMLCDDPLRKDMGLAGRKRVDERYTWERVTADLWKQYRELIGNRSGAARFAPFYEGQ